MSFAVGIIVSLLTTDNFAKTKFTEVENPIDIGA
jgi:hypothetical protein